MLGAFAISALATTPPKKYCRLYTPAWSDGSNKTWIDGDLVSEKPMDEAWMHTGKLQVGGAFTTVFGDPWINYAVGAWRNRAKVILYLPGGGTKTTIMNVWVWKVPLPLPKHYFMRINYKITHVSTIEGHTSRNVKNYHVTFQAQEDFPAPLVEPTPPGF